MAWRTSPAFKGSTDAHGCGELRLRDIPGDALAIGAIPTRAHDGEATRQEDSCVAEPRLRSIGWQRVESAGAQLRRSLPEDRNGEPKAVTP